MKCTVMAVAAIALVAVGACGGPAAHRAETTRAPAMRAPATRAQRPAAFPRVNAPCKGKIPMPFAGIAINGQISANVTSFHRATGARVRVVEFYNPFPGTFQSAQAQQAVDLGALPVIQLNPRNISLAQVVAGQYDAQIRSYAAAVKAFRCYVVLSFGHEMNGWWYPWGLPRTTPKVFKAAWRHIHDVFAAVHARNVIWSWDPTHQHSQVRGRVATPASEWYPGNRYVDWIGIDGYLGSGQNFKEVFGFQLRDIRRVADKPIYLAETGVANGRHATGQVADLFAGLRLWHLAGLVWFDLNRKNSWSLEGSPAKRAAFRKAIASFP